MLATHSRPNEHRFVAYFEKRLSYDVSITLPKIMIPSFKCFSAQLLLRLYTGYLFNHVIFALITFNSDANSVAAYSEWFLSLLLKA